MRRDPLVSVFVALASVTVCTVVAWLLFFRPTNEVVHERTRTGPTLVIQTPPLTPLQARKAKRTTAARSPDSTTRVVSGKRLPTTDKRGLAVPSQQPQKRPVTPRKRKTARTPQKPFQASTGTSTQPSAPSQPPPVVSVPLPSICTQPIHVGTCP